MIFHITVFHMSVLFLQHEPVTWTEMMIWGQDDVSTGSFGSDQ